MHVVELHSRGKGWHPDSSGAHGDEASDSGFGKIQAADSADMHRMGKKQQFRVCTAGTRFSPPSLTSPVAQLPRRVHLKLLSGCDDGLRFYPNVSGCHSIS
jgi:hypothetical protein